MNRTDRCSDASETEALTAAAEMICQPVEKNSTNMMTCMQSLKEDRMVRRIKRFTSIQVMQAMIRLQRQSSLSATTIIIIVSDVSVE